MSCRAWACTGVLTVPSGIRVVGMHLVVHSNCPETDSSSCSSSCTLPCTGQPAHHQLSNYAPHPTLLCKCWAYVCRGDVSCKNFGLLQSSGPSWWWMSNNTCWSADGNNSVLWHAFTTDSARQRLLLYCSSTGPTQSQLLGLLSSGSRLLLPPTCFTVLIVLLLRLLHNLPYAGAGGLAGHTRC